MSATSSVTRVILWIVRLSGIAQLVVGVLLWTGRGGALLRPHMVNGFLIVALLWILAILALVARARVVAVHRDDADVRVHRTEAVLVERQRSVVVCQDRLRSVVSHHRTPTCSW